MKKILVCLMVMVCLLGLGSVAFGNSGKAIIPHYSVYQSSDSFHATSFFSSNLSNEPIDIKITLYNQNGTIITGFDFVHAAINLLNYNNNPIDATITFTLDPHATGSFQLKKTGSTVFGHGIIEWTQNSKIGNGLIAYGYDLFYNSSGYSRTLIPVNNCLPF